jgi:hypothetical protein
VIINPSSPFLTSHLLPNRCGAVRNEHEEMVSRNIHDGAVIPRANRSSRSYDTDKACPTGPTDMRSICNFYFDDVIPSL